MSATEDSDSFSSFLLSSNVSGSETEGDLLEVSGVVEPYRFEPSASEDDEEPENEEDEDGLTPAILEARSENQITVDTW